MKESFKHFKIDIEWILRIPASNKYYIKFSRKSNDDDFCIIFATKYDTGFRSIYKKVRGLFGGKPLLFKEYFENDYYEKEEFYAALNYVVEHKSKRLNYQKIGYDFDEDINDWWFFPILCDDDDDYDQLCDYYDEDNKIELEYQFLPTNLEYNDSRKQIEESHKIVAEFLKKNPIYTPLFLYTLTALSEKLILKNGLCACQDYRDFFCEISGQRAIEVRIWFSLWLHGDEKKLNTAANLFLNVFQYKTPSIISNQHKIHINTLKKVYHLKDFNISNMEQRFRYGFIIDEHAKQIEDVPILVYPKNGKLSPRLKSINEIIEERSNGYYNYWPAFLAHRGTKSNKVFDVDLSDAPSISVESFKELKPHINFLYKEFIEYILILFKTPETVPEGVEITTDVEAIRYLKKYYNYDFIKNWLSKRNKPKPDNIIYRYLYCFRLIISTVLYGCFLSFKEVDDFEYYRKMQFDLFAVTNKQYDLLNKENDSAIISDCNKFIKYLKNLVKKHINDTPQECVWIDEHKVAAEKFEKVYSFNDKFIINFLKRNISCKPIDVKRALFKEGIMFKDEKRYVFNKDINGTKYYVYKIRASLFEE